ncbi:heme exporter protein A [Litoreibacter ponti]|uniref:Heme exporter protein A n=1 Tax=Litoreibacter ponti TaxID=1510457 RepID=A0A2T6BH90_9RHOB|nr:heme ABC exporter ATP-binding protein CcmA [Litoreibacter ponti]PTX55424.1 heme exporter protein A [Litoreibacter ponti]
MEFSVQNLACRRGPVTVLSDVCFSVSGGEALILRGPNGAGKTTLLRCLAGLTPPVSGTLNTSCDDVAYAAHADGLKAQLSVAENLQFWADIFGTGDIRPAVEAFDLGDLLTRRAQDLSAGQKRRLSLSRLLLTGRPVWALDEPTVSLDTENVARFAAAVTAHLDAGGAAIIATHIDLGLPAARVLDVGQFKATRAAAPESDPFLDEALS